MNIRIASSIAAALALAISSAATADITGDADNYNVFIFGTGSFTSQDTDTMGNLAAGGNVTLTSYQVAQGIHGTTPTPQTPNAARLVVGGLLTSNNGGQVGMGGTGSIYTNQTPVMNNGGFTSAGVLPLSQSGISSFSADATQYTNLSSSLGGLAANGATSTSNGGGTLSLTGTAAGLNVFSVSASTLAGANTVDISAPTGATVLIDVSGTSATLPSGMVFFANGASASKVLYNFYQATSVALTSSNPDGSILAPLAGVTGTFGQMNGQLIAGSYSGETQFDATPFTGSLAPVPLPAPVWLLCSALLAGLFTVKRRQPLPAMHHSRPAPFLA